MGIETCPVCGLDLSECAMIKQHFAMGWCFAAFVVAMAIFGAGIFQAAERRSYPAVAVLSVISLLALVKGLRTLCLTSSLPYPI
jgi:hypothetical protein